jgi:Threonine dehydrogenase and related Zn-dependent dehydrogenases
LKAAIFKGPSNIEISEIPIPKPGPDELLIKNIRIGICPTDLRYYKGLRKESTYDNPLFTTGIDTYGLSGHEVVGEVVELGDEVKGFEIGDIVTHETFTYCGNCRYCKDGLINLCENKKDIARGYSEYYKVPYKFVYKFSKSVDPKFGAFAEPLAVVIHAVKKVPQKNLAILGAGPMGMLMAIYSRHLGKNVVLIEIKKSRYEFARSLGINALPPDISVNPSTIKEILKDSIYGVISSIGGRSAVENAISIASDSAPIVIFGGTYPPDFIALDLNTIHYSEKIITGSTDHTREDMKESIELIEKKALPLDKLVTKEFKFQELKNAFDAALNGDEMKIQVTFV